MKTSEMRSDYEAAEDWLKSIDPFSLAEEFRDHREAAYLEERAKIVAWLRAQNRLASLDLEQILADDIEAGEHLA
jgi:hypothetical protein